MDLSTDPFSIRARQTILIRQGSLDELVVTLPQGLDLANSDAESLDPRGGIETLTIDDAREPPRVRIKLREPVSDRLELDWSLRTADGELARRWLPSSEESGSSWKYQLGAWSFIRRATVAPPCPRSRACRLSRTAAYASVPARRSEKRPRPT